MPKGDEVTTIHHGDCIETMKSMPPESVDAIVTDPPYGLSNTDPGLVADTITKWAGGDREHVPTGRGFMGKSWDAFVPPPAVWDECLRVLKPGGHMVVFAGSRTQDLMGLSIRLAGFEMRDSLAWLYGSGFPKSHDVSKGIDKVNGEAGRLHKFTAWMRTTGITARQLNEATGTNMGGHYLTAASQPAIPTPDLWAKIRPLASEVPAWVDELVERIEAEREILHEKPAFGIGGKGTYNGHTEGATYKQLGEAVTPEAAQWAGWGTALKPAHEPIILARKPFKGTVAGNVLTHGAGAINVDACRIGLRDDESAEALQARSGGVRGFGDQYVGGKSKGAPPTDMSRGRWPANVLLDQHTAAWVDEQSGYSKSPTSTGRGAGGQHGITSPRGAQGRVWAPGDEGGASRFFYTAKAPKRERPNVDGVQHPTVKPLAIMRWLIRLVTPPGGTVLDPFAGSGATIEAALIEGFNPVGIEMETDYLPLIQHRIDRQAAQLDI